MSGRWTRGRAVALATLVAGTLDLAGASLLAHHPARYGLQTLIGERAFGGGWTTALAGAAIHYLLAFVMAAVFILEIATRRPVLRRPFLSAMIYGALLWAVLYLVALPLRWPAIYPRFGLAGTTAELFCHIVLVGVPIGWATSRLRR